MQRLDFLRKSFLMLKTKSCHSEQSEESEILRQICQILRFAQNDKGFFKALKDFRKKSNIYLIFLMDTNATIYCLKVMLLSFLTVNIAMIVFLLDIVAVYFL